MKIITFDSLPSTNQYCELLDLTQYEEFTIINAIRQTAGIGQRGNHWEAEGGKNLTFSIILKPTFLATADQFQLTKTISLGLLDWLQTVVPQRHCVKIKWPNDIYVDQSKICGTLISAKISGSHLSSAIVGIGLNVNQTHFSDWVPNPISLSMLTGRELETTVVLNDLIEAIEVRYAQLQNSQNSPNEEYISNLLHIGEEHTYIYHGKKITATITGVNQYGHLELTTPEGQGLSCQMKEIQWML